jgi:tRNA threonylcarbamoyladenosine biosynthesis protein TsaB
VPTTSVPTSPVPPSSWRTLAIETSGDAGSVAVLEGHEVRALLKLDPARRTAQTLAPAIATALEQAGWRPRDVQLAALTVGPGSFTGLRLAVATAKAFAYAVQAGVLGVDTLEVLAAGVFAETDAGYVDAALDAQRGQVIAARFARAEAGTQRPRTARPAAIQDRAAWWQGVAAGDLVTGPILARHGAEAPAHVVAAAQHLWQPSAVWVGRLAVSDYEAGRRLSPFEVQPVYIRPSAAEEKRAEKRAAMS